MLSAAIRWNNIIRREVVKAVMHHDYEFALFLTEQLLPE